MLNNSENTRTRPIVGIKKVWCLETECEFTLWNIQIRICLCIIKIKVVVIQQIFFWQLLITETSLLSPLADSMQQCNGGTQSGGAMESQ